MDDPQRSSEPFPAAVAGLQEVLVRAQGGDLAVLPELRDALESRPVLWRHCGDLAAIAERAWIETASGPDLVVAESLKLRMAELRAELAGPSPTPLERLAVNRVAITWLQAWYADAAAAGSGDVSPKLAAFALEPLDRAQKRHLAALAVLATIRRLLPDVGGASSGDGHRRRASQAVALGSMTDADRRGPIRRPATCRESRWPIPARSPWPDVLDERDEPA